MEACGGEGRKRGRVKDGNGEEREPEAKRRMALTTPWSAAAAHPQHPSHPHPASRIYRVSRASGGKDRHSKVYTAKGIRDRRVRLSVATAIQFYDLQDRLGYDQPSKAIEWLIKAAADAIDKLPELDAAAGFPSHPASNSNKDHHQGADAAADPDTAALLEQDHHQQLTTTRSGCSSTSETSKGSVLSLSRSESRVKARERARERSAAAKDKDPDDNAATAARRTQAAPTTASFTELLTGMAAAANAAAPATAAEHKQQQQQPVTTSWPPPMAVAATTADYIGFAHPQQPRKAAGGHAAMAAHAFASPAPHLMAPAHHFGLSAAGAVTVAAGAGEPHSEMTHLSFLQDHFMPVHAAAPASTGPAAADYNLNFSMSSGLVGVNNSRGTLQSNSHISGHHQLHRLSSTPALEAPNIPSFLFSPAAAIPAPADTQFAAAFQLWNGFHHADMKEKGKN